MSLARVLWRGFRGNGGAFLSLHIPLNYGCLTALWFIVLEESFMDLGALCEGNQVRLCDDLELPWWIIGKSLGKLFEGTLEKEAEKALEKLKSILENAR
jgi:hypothetical protein